MLIGKRIRAIRERKGLSQAHLEKQAGLLRTYLSRVEHGHIVETLEKIARGLGMPLYQVFYDAEAPDIQTLTSARSSEATSSAKEAPIMKLWGGLMESDTLTAKSMEDDVRASKPIMVMLNGRQD